MKLKKIKIIIKSIEDIKTEWAAALKGKRKSTTKVDEIILPGIETVAKIFSKTKMEILRAIYNEKPQSIYALAKFLNRDFKNVYADVYLLHQIGLIELKPTTSTAHRKGLKPISKFSGFEIELAA